MPIQDRSEAFRKIRSRSASEVNEAALFLSMAGSPDCETALKNYLQNPPLYTRDATLYAITGIKDSDFLEDLYYDTKDDNLAIALGRKLFKVGRTYKDSVSTCLNIERRMCSGVLKSQEAYEEIKDSPELIKTMLDVLNNPYAAPDHLSEDYDGLWGFLAESNATNVDAVSKLIRKMPSVNDACNTLRQWVRGLSKIDPSKPNKVLTDAKNVFDNMISLQYGAALEARNHDRFAPYTPVDKVTDTLSDIIEYLPQNFTRFFCKNAVDSARQFDPQHVHKLEIGLASPEEVFAILKKNPQQYIPKITEALTSKDNIQIKAIYELLPAIYNQLGQGVVDSVWESGNEGVKIALLQAVGQRWPSTRLVDIYRSGTPQIKAAVSQMLAKNKQEYLLSSEEREF